MHANIPYPFEPDNEQKACPEFIENFMRNFLMRERRSPELIEQELRQAEARSTAFLDSLVEENAENAENAL